MAKKRKKKRGRKKIVLFIFEILVLLIVLAVLGLYNSTIGKIDFKNDLSASEAGINDDIDEDSVQTMHGYLNVALFGLDNRSSGKYDGGNSDCIMIASLNYDTNEVKLASLYRDTFLSVGKGKYYKANNAFANGGAENAVRMINSNLDMNITKYVCVDWKALVDVIDALGGLDLDLTKEGMDRYECRKALVKELQEIGALVSVEDHEHAVGHCSRCHSTIEPMISTQWFVKMDSLAKPAVEAVKTGKIKFVPERFTKIYCNWLDNIRDWCISRQLWWGHRIPAWYCDDCGETTVSRTDIDVCPKCGSKHLHQDEDVLDTWFSSGLWPFETMGWPEKTPELKQFYPTSTLVTGYDIIFFWVARMVMMGLEFGKDIPFKTVYIHGLVRDEQGRKMSKSLGNGIDPVEVIDQYGADTLRFMLITGNTPGNDMRFINDRVVATRNFANKLWNASRFMLMNLEGFDKSFVPAEEDYTLADKWIMSRYAKTAQGVTANLEKFELGEAGRLIYEFIWNEFCDWYIELAKARLYDKENLRPRQTAQYVLGYVLEGTLRLLHPFMPFITEEIWQHIPHEGISIMVSQWPGNDEKALSQLINDGDEAAMTAIMESIKTIRALRLEVNAAPGKKSEVILNFTDESLRQVFADNEGYLTVLAAAEPVTMLAAGSEKPENAMAGVVNGVEIYLPLKGLIDVDKEVARLNKEMANLEKEVSRLEKKLGNQGFLAKAPAEVVAGEQEKLKGYQEKQAAVKERLSYLATL